MRKNQEEDEMSSSLSALLQVIKHATSTHPLSETRALQSVEIQVGELAEAVTQFMVRQEKSFVEVEAQKKSLVQEHESREKQT